MMSYRTRKALGNLATAALILVLAAVAVWMVWIIWLDRFVVYSRDGAQIRFDSSAEYLIGEAVTAPDEQEPITLIYDDGASAVQVNTDLTQINGYYADSNAIISDLSAVRAQIEQLTAGTPVMIDVKDIYGYFYYSSDVGPTLSSVDTAAMDDLIAYMVDSGLYTIARLPAFRDYYFGLNETANGLFRPDGYALWNDRSTGRLTYWLDPTKDGTINYLTRIVSELKRMGFDEVVFDDFRFPNTTELEFSGDRDAAITEAAKTLAQVCSTETFCVSFISSSTDFPLPEGERCRLYLTDIAAADARTAAESLGLEDPAVQVVFLTELGDTRYDEFSVLRSLSSARIQVPEEE